MMPGSLSIHIVLPKSTHWVWVMWGLVNLEAKQWVHLNIWGKHELWTVLWHSIMLENEHVDVFTVHHLCVNKKSFALPFSNMHAKGKHRWWSDLPRASTHCLGYGHILISHYTLYWPVMCGTCVTRDSHLKFLRLLEDITAQTTSICSWHTRVWLSGILCFAKHVIIQTV